MKTHLWPHPSPRRGATLLFLSVACVNPGDDGGSFSICDHSDDTDADDSDDTSDSGADDTADTADAADTADTSDTSDTGDMDVDSYMDVTHLGVFFDGAVLDGTISDWKTSGKSRHGNFIVFVADADWSGELEDEDHSCQVWFQIVPESATPDTTFMTSSAWEGWTLDTTTTSFLGQMGTCETLDPSVWGESFYDFVTGYSWGMGLGRLDASMRTELLARDDGTDTDGNGTTDLEESISSMVGGYVMTDLAGVSAVYPYNYGFAYELDLDGELVKDGEGVPNVLKSAAGSASLVDGYYELVPGLQLPF